MRSIQFDPNLFEANLAADTGSLTQWNILRWVTLSERIDVGRLRAALAKAAQQHPLSRARRLIDSAGFWRWRLDSDAPENAVQVLNTDFVTPAPILRELQAERLSALTSCAFRCVLVRGPMADCLVFNFCHERTDGIGALAFVESLQRAYEGSGLQIKVDWIERRYCRTALPPEASIPLGLLQPEPIEHLLSEKVDLEDDSTHVVNLTISSEKLATLRRLAGAGTTITYQVVAALSLACERWNMERGGSGGRICIAIPVNARPNEWRRQGFLNRFSTMFVNTGRTERLTVNGAAESVARQARYMAPIVAASAACWGLPATQALMPAICARSIPDALVPTAAVSSLGVVSIGPFGDARPLEIWAPPLAKKPMGVALGMLGLRGGVCLSFRFAGSMISPRAGHRFAHMVRDLVLRSA